jgi:hypothetical protein
VGQRGAVHPFGRWPDIIKGAQRLVKSLVMDLDAASILQRTWRDHLTTEQIVPLTPSALDALDPV